MLEFSVEKSPPKAIPAARNAIGRPRMPAIAMPSANGAEGIRQLTEMLRRDNADEEPLEDGVDCEDNEGESFNARGRLMRGCLISSPSAQQVSKPAKHHQIMATMPIKLQPERPFILSGNTI